MIRLSLLTVITLASASLAAETARAFEFYETTGGDPLRWKRTLVEFRIATVAPAEMTLEEVESAFDRAIAAWDDSDCTPEIVRTGRVDATQGSVPPSVRGPPDNIVVFIPDTTKWSALKHGRLEIAVTVIANNPETGEIVDADIEVNDGGFEFSVSETPVAGRIDFHSTLTHELGHVFGLDHSGIGEATMFASYDAGDPATKRTLAQDDIDGVCALYAIPFPKSKDDDCAGAGTPAAWAWLLAAFVILAIRARRPPRHRHFVTFAACLAVLTVTVPSTTHAFEVTTTETGLPVHWKRDALTYRVATVVPEELTLEEVETAFDRAVATWMDTGCTPDVTRTGRAEVTNGTVPKTVAEPPDNVVVFIQDARVWMSKQDRTRFQIAVTVQIHNEDTGEMIDADIEVNDVDFEFSVAPITPPGHMDFQAVLTHELGHVWGLAHSEIPDAVMFADYTTRGDPTAKRSLHQDDIDGACAIAAMPFPEPPRAETDDGCRSGDLEGTLCAALLALCLGWRRGVARRDPVG